MWRSPGHFSTVREADLLGSGRSRATGRTRTTHRRSDFQESPDGTFFVRRRDEMGKAWEKYRPPPEPPVEAHATRSRHRHDDRVLPVLPLNSKRSIRRLQAPRAESIR